MYAGPILILVLLSVAGLSLYFTVVVVSGYAALRLYRLARHDGTWSGGWALWLEEMKELLGTGGGQPPPMLDRKVE